MHCECVFIHLFSHWHWWHERHVFSQSLDLFSWLVNKSVREDKDSGTEPIFIFVPGKVKAYCQMVSGPWSDTAPLPRNWHLKRGRSYVHWAMICAMTLAKMRNICTLTHSLITVLIGSVVRKKREERQNASKMSEGQKHEKRDQKRHKWKWNSTFLLLYNPRRTWFHGDSKSSSVVSKLMHSVCTDLSRMGKVSSAVYIHKTFTDVGRRRSYDRISKIILKDNLQQYEQWCT